MQFLVKQGLPLRGHNWFKDTGKEDGNFRNMVGFLSKYSSELAVYTFKHPTEMLQNEFIILNASLIRKKIVDQCNNTSLFWSVMADETDVSTTEQLSVCIRYVYQKSEDDTMALEVYEDFLGFVICH